MHIERKRKRELALNVLSNIITLNHIHYCFHTRTNICNHAFTTKEMRCKGCSVEEWMVRCKRMGMLRVAREARPQTPLSRISPRMAGRNFSISRPQIKRRGKIRKATNVMNTQHSQYLLPPLRCVKQEPFENRQLNHRGLGFTKSERDEVSFFKIVCKREVD